MVTPFDLRAFLLRYRELCAAADVDPDEGPQSSYEVCRLRSAYSLSVYHERAAIAVRRDARMHPDRVPDDKQDGDRFCVIMERRARADWWVGVIVRNSERAAAAAEAARQEVAREVARAKRQSFTPRFLDVPAEMPIAPGRSPLAPYGRAQTSLAAWIAHENTPEGIAARSEWEARNTRRSRKERDAENDANKRGGVYHAGPKAG